MSSTESNNHTTQGAPIGPRQVPDNLLWLGLQSHNYIGEHIKLADQKAAFFFAITTGILALFYDKGIHTNLLRSIGAWGFLDFIGALSIILLIMSTLLSFFVVKPRLRASVTMGLVYWESVRKFPTPDAYSQRMLQLSRKDVIEELFQHHFELSGICGRKYRLLNYSMGTALAGMFLSIVSLISA